MKEEEKARLLALYEGRYRALGYDVKTVGWGDHASQELRFKILCDIADLAGSSICDLGCGFGDLYPYVTHRFGAVDYFGIDLSPELIAEAGRHYPGVKVAVADVLEKPPKAKFDYVLSSGALSFKVENHVKYVEKMLRTMFDMATKGVAVNFLSTMVDYQLEKNFHFEPAEALAMALTLTKRVVLRSDYPLYEFTIYLYK